MVLLTNFLKSAAFPIIYLIMSVVFVWWAVGHLDYYNPAYHTYNFPLLYLIALLTISFIIPAILYTLISPEEVSTPLAKVDTPIPPPAEKISPTHNKCETSKESPKNKTNAEPIKTNSGRVQNTQVKTQKVETCEPISNSNNTKAPQINSEPAPIQKNERVRKISREDLKKHKTEATPINKSTAQIRPLKMNKKEAQIFLGKDSATITALIHSGTIPSYREGRYLYLHRDDLEIYKNEVAQNRHILMTKEEARNFINVSISTLNILLRKGSIPIQRYGGRVFFFRQDLEKYNNETAPDRDTKLNIKEACIFLGKQRKTIYKLIRNGLIPSYITGEGIFFFHKHLEEYKNGVARKAHIRLNVKDACRFLDRSDVTVYKLIRSGQIPSYKDGQSIVLFQEHLERYKTEVGLFEWVKMNKEEACDFLDIDRVSFKILCDNGAIPSHRDGKRLFFYHRDLARYKNEVTQLFMDR